MPHPQLVLDTNIISETLKKQPDERVLAWLLQNQESLYLNAITVGELWEGAYRLPQGKRRESLLLALERITGRYENRILSYDGTAAQHYARLRNEARNHGRALTVEDGMIAATCIASSSVLVTRNMKDFEYLGIALVNPFEEPTPDVAEISF